MYVHRTRDVIAQVCIKWDGTGQSGDPEEETEWHGQGTNVRCH